MRFGLNEAEIIQGESRKTPQISLIKYHETMFWDLENWYHQAQMTPADDKNIHNHISGSIAHHFLSHFISSWLNHLRLHKHQDCSFPSFNSHKPWLAQSTYYLHFSNEDTKDSWTLMDLAKVTQWKTQDLISNLSDSKACLLSFFVKQFPLININIQIVFHCWECHKLAITA